MYKLFFTSLLALMLAAQHSQAQLAVGVKAGGMLSNTAVINSNLNFARTHAKAGMVGGIFVRVPVAGKLSLQPELLYANKGTRTNMAGTSTLAYKVNRHYIAIPVMLQYGIFKGLTLEAGPEVAYLLGSSLIAEDYRSFRRNLQDREWDVNLNIGVQYALSQRISANLRYNLGILDTHRTFFINSYDFSGLVDADIRNRSMQLSVGYRLF